MCEENNSCGLLYDSRTYNPDTFDLQKDKEAFDYWFLCFKDLVNKFAIQAALSQKNDPTAEKRAQDFKMNI